MSTTAPARPADLVVLARGLVRACHPEPTLAVTALITALAVAADAPAPSVAAALLAGQLTTGWSNDWIDRDRDQASGRTDKPVPQGVLPARVLGLAALAAGLATVPLSLLLGPAAGLLHLAAVASALSYNALLKATPLSFLPYALSFGALPSVVTLTTDPGVVAPLWATAGAALLGVGAHLANVLPDLEDDLATGVRGLPHRLGRSRATGAMAVLLLAATVVLALGPGGAGAPELVVVALAAALAGAAVLLAARRPGSRGPFLLALAVAGVDVLVLLSRGAALTGT